MFEKFGGAKTFLKEKTGQATKLVNGFVDHKDTKAAVAWTTETIGTAAVEAVDLGKRAARPDMTKDAATGAVIGAAVAVPIPIIESLFGAVVGAGAGMLVGRKGGDSSRTIGLERKSRSCSTNSTSTRN